MSTDTVTQISTPPRELTPYERFRQYVEAPLFKRDLVLLLGNDKAASLFIRVVLTATQQTPGLLMANRRTLLLACMKAGRDRLMPDGKEAVLNIYNTKVKTKDDNGREVEKWEPQVQYLPMVAGIIKKMYDSGLVLNVSAHAVYERDEFSYELGDEPRIKHVPCLSDDAGPVIAAYCVVKMSNGEIKRAVMPRRDIEKTRLASKSPDGLMWKTWYDQGAIKAVIKRIYKQMPSSPELDQLIAHDNEAMGDANIERQPGLEDPMDESATHQPLSLEHQPTESIPAMAVERQPTRTEAVKEALKTRRASAARQNQPPPIEGTVTSTAPQFTAEGLSLELDNALIMEQLDLVADKIRSANLPDAEAAPLWKKYTDRKQEIDK